MTPQIVPNALNKVKIEARISISPGSGRMPEPGDFGGTVVRLREYEAFVSFPVYSAVVQFPLYSDELRMPEYEESLSFPSYELYSPVNRRR